MNAIPFDQFRDELARQIDEVARNKTVLHIERENDQNVVVMAEDEYNGWMETIHLLGSPTNAERLLKSIAELDAGKGQEHDLIEP
jgi:antitoxin YefM